MPGHQTPCRKQAWQKLLRVKRSRSLTISLTLIAAVVILLATALAAGCGSSGSTATSQSGGVTTTVAAASAGKFPATIVDDNKESVTIKAKPVRIVSTAPSNTEILFALGLSDRIVGVSSLDDYPAEAKSKAKVGDYTLNTEKILSLNPDLVVAYSGNEDALKQVKAAGIPVIVFNPQTIDDIYTSITKIGEATGDTQKAAALVAATKAQMQAVSVAAAKTGTKPKVFYAVDNTLWTVGTGTFVDNLLTMANATNVAASTDAKSQGYYQFSAERLVAADPDIILVPNTAYKSVSEFTSDARFSGLRAVKEGHVYLVDDVIVTRPGPRIAQGLQVLVDYIHPSSK